MRVWDELMEANLVNTMEINCCWTGKGNVNSSNRDGQRQRPARRAGLLCDTTNQRIGCTYALIPNKIYSIPFNVKRQMELVDSLLPFAKSPYRCASCYRC